MPCKYCKDLNARSEIGGFFVEISDLQESCRFCLLLHQLIRHFAPSIEAQQTNAFLRIDQLGQDVIDVEVVVKDMVKSGSLTSLAIFYVYNPSGYPISDFPRLGRLGHYSFHPYSNESFAFINEKLHHCIESHEQCKQSEPAPVPKRLLSIGTCENDTIRLAEPGNTRLRYISLSHCWGGYQPIKTTSANLLLMKNKIPWHDLSNVFQDAIKIARKLDIEWIWIDSLCIIQDSKNDWEIESAKMCDYYSNAYLTISASSSKDGTVSFLQQRDEKWWPKVFPFTNIDCTESLIQARRRQGSTMTEEIEDLGPLASRGWVWQENALSTRILHYTEAELIWECRSEICAEDGAVPRGFYSMRLSQQLWIGKRDPYRCWNYLIELYSVRKLTFESDRLPAVSGVAAKIQEMVGKDAKYLAGLWMGNIQLGLCWSVNYTASESSNSPQPLPEGFIAPSWSWASIHGPLTFFDMDQSTSFEPLAEVLDAKCTVPGLNPYGEVTSGYLILRGPVVSMMLNCANPYNCWAYTVGENPEIREPMGPDCILIPFERNGRNSIKRARKGEVPVAFSLEVECIRLGNEKGGDEEFMYGLVLGLSETGDGYTRLGLVLLDSEYWFDEAVEKTLKII